MKSRYFLHLATLSSFAVAAPVFAKLGPAPGYFAAHGLTSTEVVLLAIALVVVPPVLLFIPELIVVKRRLRWVVHLVLVAALVALTVLPPLGGLSGPAAYVVAGALGVGFAFVYARFRNVRLFTTWLGFAPVLFLAWFLFASPSAKFVAGDQSDAWKAADSFRPPIVFLQFDALPSLLLETPDHHIDAQRYPNFAQLARDGVWYRNASNVHENTVFSVPSFVDGQLPRKGTKPWVQDHNPNLFTLLGPTYKMNVAEEATTLCPYQFCLRGQPSDGAFWDDTRIVFENTVKPANKREDLPSISHRWTDFADGPLQTTFSTRMRTPEYVIRHLRSGRIGRFDRWFERLGPGGAHPQLNYVHVFLPHEPREFIPDGRRYVTPDPALSRTEAYDNRYLSDLEEQRTLLQLGYTDRVVGKVLTRLKQLGIYDDALIVVVADHGESFLPPKSTPAGPFVPGRLGYRRAVTRHNIEDIASIPMFIKYPKGHGPTGTDDRYVRAPDVFPTIAGRLGLKMPPLAGRDLNSPDYRGHGDVVVATTYDDPVTVPVTRWQKARDASLRRRVTLFGSGKRSVYDWGAHRRLLGKPVADFEFFPTSTVHATVDGARRFRNVNPVAPVCLCLIGGQIQGAAPEGMQLAIAVNGRIAATAVGFRARGAKRLNWAATIPPSAYHDGSNTVQVLRMVGPNRLEAIGGAT